MVEKSKERPRSAQISTDETLAANPVKRERSDALVSVGNFLGAGRGAIDSVAQRQPATARQQLQVVTEASKEAVKKVELQKAADDLIKAFH